MARPSTSSKTGCIRIGNHGLVALMLCCSSLLAQVDFVECQFPCLQTYCDRDTFCNDASCLLTGLVQRFCDELSFEHYDGCVCVDGGAGLAGTKTLCEGLNRLGDGIQMQKASFKWLTTGPATFDTTVHETKCDARDSKSSVTCMKPALTSFVATTDYWQFPSITFDITLPVKNFGQFPIAAFYADNTMILPGACPSLEISQAPGTCAIHTETIYTMNLEGYQFQYDVRMTGGATMKFLFPTDAKKVMGEPSGGKRNDWWIPLDKMVDFLKSTAGGLPFSYSLSGSTVTVTGHGTIVDKTFSVNTDCTVKSC